MGDSLMTLGQHEAAERAFATALNLTPPADPLARAILYHKASDTFQARLLLAEAEAESDQALALLGPPGVGWSMEWQHAWLDQQLSRMDILYSKGDLDRLAELIDAIEPTVKAVGAPDHRADFAKGLVELSLRREHFTLSAHTVSRSETLLAAARETGDLAQIAWAHFGVGFCLLWSGQTTEAAAPLLTGLKQAQEGGLAHTEVLCLTYLACLHRFLGDTGEGRRYAEHSLAASEQVDMPVYRAMAHANLAALHWHDGRADAAHVDAERASTLWGEYPYPFRWLANWVLLAVYAARGELAEGVGQARAILHPTQRRQPGDLPALLAAAERAWENGKPDETRAALQRAIELAQAEGYL
jgi:tetratricopeptide (TPR) repeat protein